MAVEQAYLEGRWQGGEPLFEASAQAREQLCMVRMLPPITSVQIYCPDADTRAAFEYPLVSQHRTRRQALLHGMSSAANTRSQPNSQI